MRKKNTEPLQTSTYYHIYNRGVDSKAIFRDDMNYFYFLNLYAKYIPLVADTYAYCLMGNHFHFLIKTKSSIEITAAITNPVRVQHPSSFISVQFSKLFNSYAQAYNKMYDRTGTLFETPFRRKEVIDERYFTGLIYYIHSNPTKHGVCNDFTKYRHSSYSSFISDKNTQLKKAEVLEWFGGEKRFIEFHQVK